jgi:hypothetical protein
MTDHWKPPSDQPELPPFFTRALVKAVAVGGLTGALLGAAWGMLLGYARQTYYTAAGEVAVEPGEFGRTPAGQERWQATLKDLKTMAEMMNDSAVANEEESIHCSFDREKALFSVEITSVTRSLTSEGVNRIMETLENVTASIRGMTKKELRDLNEAEWKVKEDSHVFTERGWSLETASELTGSELQVIAASPELTKRFEKWKEDCARLESMKDALRTKGSEGVVAVAKVVRAPGEPRELAKPPMAPAVAVRSAIVAAGFAALTLLILWFRYLHRYRPVPVDTKAQENAEF